MCHAGTVPVCFLLILVFCFFRLTLYLKIKSIEIMAFWSWQNDVDTQHWNTTSKCFTRVFVSCPYICRPAMLILCNKQDVGMAKGAALIQV